MEIQELKNMGKEGISQLKSDEIKSFIEDLGITEIPTKKSDRIETLWAELDSFSAENEIRRDKTTTVSMGVVDLVREIVGGDIVNPLTSEFARIQSDLEQLVGKEFTLEEYTQKFNQWKQGTTELSDNKAVDIVLKNNFTMVSKMKTGKEISFTSMVRAIIRKFIFDNHPTIKSNEDLWKMGYLNSENITERTEKNVTEVLSKL